MVKRKAESDPIAVPRGEGFCVEEGWSEVVVESCQGAESLNPTGQADYRTTTAIHVSSELATATREQGHIGIAGGSAGHAEATLAQVANEAVEGEHPFRSLLRAAWYETW